jgi:hypothetical protein
MTPRQFHDTYRPTADTVSLGTGIDPLVLLAQWANETAWGTVVVGNNLGNIRCSPTTFCQYVTLGDFALACIATWHNGYYAAVLAAVGPAAQLAAICASPWSSGHYGGSLQSFYAPLEAFDMTPEQDTLLRKVYNLLMNGFHTGGDPASQGYDFNVIKPQLDAIQKAIPPAGGSDVKPVLDAIAALKSDLAATTAVLIKIENALKAA